jgi:hypothetical protein
VNTSLSRFHQASRRGHAWLRQAGVAEGLGIDIAFQPYGLLHCASGDHCLRVSEHAFNYWVDMSRRLVGRPIQATGVLLAEPSPGKHLWHGQIRPDIFQLEALSAPL